MTELPEQSAPEQSKSDLGIIALVGTILTVVAVFVVFHSNLLNDLGSPTGNDPVTDNLDSEVLSTHSQNDKNNSPRGDNVPSTVSDASLSMTSNESDSLLSEIVSDPDILNRMVQDISLMLNTSASRCYVSWPEVQNCRVWYESPLENARYLLTNSIPSYLVPPYCPFGTGQGYCFTGTDHKNCSVFYNMSCPAASHRSNTTGDVPVPQLFVYRFELYPNPLNNSLPLGLYEKNPVVWAYNNGSQQIFDYDIDSGEYIDLNNYTMPWQMIGAHVTGQQIKGPDEAENYNVDMTGLHLESMCGGHVTPPIGGGPFYHYHKAALCLEKFPEPMHTDAYVELIDDKNAAQTGEQNVNNIGQESQKSRQGLTTSSDEFVMARYPHSELQGYSNDGFGIYGLYDFDESDPVLDECNGHFGATGRFYNAPVVYHYHYRNFTWDGNSTFEPYYMGCQGPSKGLCNQTLANATHRSSPICGPGCGYEICVQPGTSQRQLTQYLTDWGDADWMQQFTVNPF